MFGWLPGPGVCKKLYDVLEQFCDASPCFHNVCKQFCEIFGWSCDVARWSKMHAIGFVMYSGCFITYVLGLMGYASGFIMYYGGCMPYQSGL